ncbi:hypothetical protein KUH03_33585 [Sphingobacterium sp. E70]|uniref:hypothetical protein n=1 Tax=Sphingobacterium sp. E70 TaxID=2853439 RepID=UPI00211CF69C|nr:hypothetical protein [Sphingobacterium sp. E70]ULT23996.1 hypothetical protein KUH03_33585 [Sphingobacterium sp. E70]
MKNYRLFNFIAIAVATFFLSSCLKDNDDQRIPGALFTMVNGYTDANAVVYYADGDPYKVHIIPWILKAIAKLAYLRG